MEDRNPGLPLRLVCSPCIPMGSVHSSQHRILPDQIQVFLQVLLQLSIAFTSLFKAPRISCQTLCPTFSFSWMSTLALLSRGCG
jgi:hypothetical protein